MPLFGVNMAIPVKEHVRESRIYFLVSTESVPPDNQTVQRKYLIFKTVELILSLCSLMLFAYSMRVTENEILDMLKYIALGGLTIYPLLFILLNVNVERKPVVSIILNASAAVLFFTIGATTMWSSWGQSTRFQRHDKVKSFETTMQLRSSFLIVVCGFFYFIESLLMCIGIRNPASAN
ncbi:hypothetical protein Zmor_022046 [Zophobas morio]|uniref:Uncharacterized protein n=1 Tax=Zophobas morio TaxID=2755281 RepID=A0AA38I3I9_9CUCU|nr:hypothetical protein Zmor_022046 [Zophobas morio]